MPPTRPRSITGEELDLLRNSVNRALGLVTAKEQLPAEINSGRWEQLWRLCAGEVEEACTVARYGQKQCLEVGRGISLKSILRNWNDWLPSSQQSLGGAGAASNDDAIAKLKTRGAA